MVKIEDEVDSLSGATITSKAMTNGINGALDFYDLLKGRWKYEEVFKTFI